MNSDDNTATNITQTGLGAPFDASSSQDAPLNTAILAFTITSILFCLGGSATAVALLYLYSRRRSSLPVRDGDSGTPLNNSPTESVRRDSVHQRTIIKGCYELVTRVHQTETELIKQQTGIVISIPDNKRSAKWTGGNGTFGKIGLAYDKKNNRFQAVKKIKGGVAIKHSREEGGIQQKLTGQPNIMPLLDSVETTDSAGQAVLYQFMPLAGWGNGDFFTQQLAFCPDLTIQLKLMIYFAKSLLTGLAAMHRANIYHRDIKPSNVVFDKDGNLYIIDFGCAKEGLEGGGIKNGFGDLRYFSPERLALTQREKSIHQNDGVSMVSIVSTTNAKADDAWAAGLTLLTILLNQYPFRWISKDDFLNHWDGQRFRDELQGVQEALSTKNDALVALIKALLIFSPQERLTPEAALGKNIFQYLNHQFSKGQRIEMFERLKTSTFDSNVSTQPSEFVVSNHRDPAAYYDPSFHRFFRRQQNQGQQETLPYHHYQEEEGEGGESREAPTYSNDSEVTAENGTTSHHQPEAEQRETPTYSNEQDGTTTGSSHDVSFNV